MKQNELNPKGIVHIYTLPPWKISHLNDPARFFRSLSLIAPFGSILEFEGYDRTPVFRRFLRSYPPKVQIGYRSRHVAWMEPMTFTQSFATDFAAFQYNHPGKARFEHLYGFSQTHEMLFWFHDAFTGGDLAVTRSVFSPKIRRFCQELGPQYTPMKPIC